MRSSKQSEEYQVSLGNLGEQFPSCECAGWKNTMLPCKHMLVLFEKLDEVSWESLPSSYMQSPFLNLDDAVIDVVEAVSQDHTEYTAVISNDGVDTNDTLFEIPKKIYPKRSKACACREILSQIKSLTYLVYDSEALEELEEKLLDVLKTLTEMFQVCMYVCRFTSFITTII